MCDILEYHIEGQGFSDMALLTIEESIIGGAAAVARNKEREAWAELVAFVEDTYILTFSEGLIEFTASFSPIVPVVVIRGGIIGGVVQMRAEAGAGQSVSADTLAACAAVAMRQLYANKAERLAEGQAN